MLFPNADLERIVSGEIDLAFRRWKRRMHVPGGRQRTRFGVIEFVAVDRVDPASLTEDDATRAGTSLPRLLAFLERKDGDVYRIQLRFGGPDERVTLRESAPSAQEVAEVIERLAGMDRRSKRGPWTQQHLELIEARPAELAETIAASIGREKKPFKADIRRLKELGLTESLPTGYRLSPRGRAVLTKIQSE